MPLTPFKIFILLCGFCSRFHAIEYIHTSQKEVLRGSEVSLRCDVSFLSESSTLQWEKDGEPTSNTTLLYNNSAYIILHTVDKHSEGKYYCRLMEGEKVETVRNFTLDVSSTSYTGNIPMNYKQVVIYRQSSNSDALLICKSVKEYKSWRWTWEQRPKSEIDLIAGEKGREVQVKGPIQPGRLSSTTFNNKSFIFHISPVNFNYNGKYRCITNTGIFTTTILHTIRVSVEPPDGVLKNQSVILTCELSEVTDSVTLAWLRMEGNRGVLGKQQNMTEKNKKLQLTVNLSSNETDLLRWQCAVFTENTLRALATIINSSSTKDPSTTESTETSTTHDPSTTVSSVSAINKAVSSVLPLFAGILLGALLYYFYRKRMSVISVRSDPQESEPVYINISQMRNDRERSRSLGNREKSSKMYHNERYEKTNIKKRDETPVTSDSVTYATVYFNKSRFQT